VEPDAELSARSRATLLASWEEYARGAVGASLQRHAAVALAVFPNDPERAVYNNALFDFELTARARADALDAMDDAYTAAGVDRFAAWVHESDRETRLSLERRGYTLDTATRARARSLDGELPSSPRIDLAPPDWREHLRVAGVPSDFLAAADPSVYHVLLARHDGETVATALAFDHDGDCGIYNVGTLEHARRRGLASALATIQLRDARARDCTTASLQATRVAERLYAAIGFRDLGRFLEYVPPPVRAFGEHAPPPR
jgi:ribosomal protein S18 acetylase RimI-like enzyme